MGVFVYVAAGTRWIDVLSRHIRCSLTTITQLVHHGMLFLPLGYTFGSGMFETVEVKGGSSYGAGTYAGDETRKPTEVELQQAFYQGNGCAMACQSGWDTQCESCLICCSSHRAGTRWMDVLSRHIRCSLTAITQLAHHGMLFLPLGYTFGSGMFEIDELKGGSSYGAGTYAGDGTRKPTEISFMDTDAARTARESLELVFQMSNILDTGLDRHTLSVLVVLCDLGLNPEALAAVVKEYRRDRPLTSSMTPTTPSTN